MDERARRAASFSAVADAYERARPEYPEEAVRWLAGAPPSDVVDLAAGTGKLTRVLVRLGHRVTAVEPLPEMREQLTAAVPGVAAVREGTAEAIPLADESAEAVVAGQAFHWFDEQEALREIARVLRPGGALGLIWNVRDDEVEWVARLGTLIRGERLHGYEPRAIIDASGRYGDVAEAQWRWEQRLDRDGLLDLVRSRSYCAALPEDERRAVLGAVEKLHDEVAGDDGLVMPYVTACFRAQRH